MPRGWDQPHAVNAGISFDAANWTFTLAWRYHTGWPNTPVSRGPDGEAVVGERNSDRLRPYHRMDLRASRRVALENSELQFYFEFINLYNRKNECCRNVLQFDIPSDDPLVFEETEQWLPFTPSLGVKWEF